jgi:hypothetical protein
MAISTAIKATRILKNLGKGSDQTAAAVEAAAALRAKQYIFAENSFEPAFKSFNALENGFDDKTAALIIKRLQKKGVEIDDYVTGVDLSRVLGLPDNAVKDAIRTVKKESHKTPGAFAKLKQKELSQIKTEQLSFGEGIGSTTYKQPLTFHAGDFVNALHKISTFKKTRRVASNRSDLTKTQSDWHRQGVQSFFENSNNMAKLDGVVAGNRNNFNAAHKSVLDEIKDFSNKTKSVNQAQGNTAYSPDYIEVDHVKGLSQGFQQMGIHKKDFGEFLIANNKDITKLKDRFEYKKLLNEFLLDKVKLNNNDFFNYNNLVGLFGVKNLTQLPKRINEIKSGAVTKGNIFDNPFDSLSGRAVRLKNHSDELNDLLYIKNQKTSKSQVKLFENNQQLLKDKYGTKMYDDRKQFFGALDFRINKLTNQINNHEARILDHAKNVKKLEAEGYTMPSMTTENMPRGVLAREGFDDGGTVGLPSFDELLKINEEKYGLVGQDLINEAIKDFFKSRNRAGFAKGGSIRGAEYDARADNEVGMFESLLAGIGAGILDIPRGAFSLGASLVDLGFGTNNAAQVEKWFDDLTTLDEKAEATTAGKISRVMTNLGIPGTFAYRSAAGLAKSAIQARKAGTYWKPTKNAAGELEKTLTNKGRMLSTLGGVGGVAASDAIFVGDAERVGTLGDAFNIGPTQLVENDANIASRTVMNRVKFGLDSAMLGGIIGGTGTAIAQAVKRSDKLNRNNDFIDTILEYTTPQGKKTKEFFEMEREMIGLRSADINRAQELHRQLDKNIDALYPFMSKVTGFGVQKQRDAMVKKINDALVSSKDGPKVTPIVEDGITIGANFTLGDMSEKALQEVKKLGLKDPDEVIRIMQQSRKIMDNSFTDIGSNIFKFGKTTKEASADTLERFTKFRKAFETKSLDYINDTYQIFGNKNSEALKSFRPTEEALTNAKELFKQLSLKRTGKTLTDEQAAFEVERILESARKQNKFLTEGEAVPLIKDETGFLKDIAVKDWREEYLPLNKIAGEVSEDVLVKGLTPRKIIDDLFGKVEDPSATILSSLSDLSLVRRKHEFFGDLFDTMNGKQFFADRRDAARVFGENNVGEKSIQMLATNPGGKLNIEAVNPLNGLYTSKGIQEALEGVNKGWFSFTEGDNMFSSLYNNFVLYPKATSQLAKTVLSPITHMRNLISAAAFSAANGIIPLMNKEALDEAMGAFRQVGSRGSEASNKRYRELLRLGVVNKNARLGDLEDLLADVDFGSKASQIRALRSFTKAGGRAKEFATDAYTAEDDFWKIFTFASERSRIDKALQKAGIDRSAFATSADNDLGRAFGSVDEYLDEAAANIVRNNVPNYDYVSKFVKDLRRAPLGNFVSFPAEIIRTSVNILGKGLKEFNYIDPITKTRPFRSIGMQRMAGFGATAVAIPYATVEAFKAAYNVSGVEMDALRRFVPDWSKNSTLIPIKDDNGDLKYIDFSHANAYDTMIRPFKTIMNAVADGRTDDDTIMEDLLQGVVESTTELGSPFISESIWTQSISDVFLRGGRTKDGRRLYTEQTPFGDRVAKAIYHMAEAQLPGSIAQGNRLLKSVNKDPDKYGKTYDFLDELGGIAGLRAVEIDPVNSMKFKIADFRTGINNARREFTSPLLRGGPVTPEQIVDRYKIANEALYQVQKNMSQDYYAAQILGANARSLNREFKDRVSNAQLRSIIRGDFKPFIPSDNIRKAFRENAEKIGQPDPFREARSTINNIARQYSKLKLFGDFLPDVNNPFKASTVGLPNLGTTQNSLPSLNTNINSMTGGSSNLGLNQTLQKGQQVFGPNDTVFGS